MKPAHLAALFLFLLVLLAAVVRGRPRAVQPLAPVTGSLTVLLVERLSLTELQGLPGILPTDPVALLPARAGTGAWDLAETIATGSRSPLPATAPRLGPFPRVRSAAQVGPWLQRNQPLLIVSLSSGPERFVPLCLHGTTQAGLLTSPSTGFRPGLVAATDLAQTIAALQGQTDTKYGAGRAIVATSIPPSGLLLERTALDSQARTVRFLVFFPWVVSPLLLLAAWRRWQALAAFGAAFPVGLLVAPLFVSGEWTYLIALGFALLVAFGKPAFAPRGLAWSVLALLTLDQLLSLGLLYRSPLSFSAAEAARFYGIGNETGGLLIGAALVAAGGDTLCVVLLGLATALLLGAPMLGANAGCFLAMLVATGAALVGRAPVKARLPLAALALVLLIGGGAGVALWDASRGRERSHIGEAVVSNQSTLQELVVRKLLMNAHLTTTSPWALLFFLQLALLAYQRRWPTTWDIALGAIAVWLLNDAGIVAGATCLLLAVPAQDTRLRKPQPPSQARA